ncbi:MAG: SCO1664 family protein [Dehalococcoidia bacterium]|nr:SCO1664 family protein [Dehalococcoidia bacterium]
MPLDSPEDVVRLMSRGEITSLQLHPWGSNYTFVARVRDSTGECLAIYKPRDGEIPLWDFPDHTLYKREYAAYLFSRVLGWDFIPLTVIREGPHGIGSLQYYVDHDPRATYYDLRETDSDALRTMACFDLVSNNADRKAVHFLRDTAGKVWGIDHGLTFNSTMKVRTVVWDFAGEAIPAHLLQALSGFLRRLVRPDDDVGELMELLDEEEVAALVHRIAWILDVGEYPAIRRRRYRR